MYSILRFGYRHNEFLDRGIAHTNSSLHPGVHLANSIKLAHYSHIPTLTLIESGWDFSFLYLMNYQYFRSFRNKLSKNSFSFYKSTLSKPYSLNDCPLLRSPNRVIVYRIPRSVQRIEKKQTERSPNSSDHPSNPKVFYLCLFIGQFVC